MEIYAVLTGDIVKSRQISDRDRMMSELKSVLEYVKEEYGAEYDLFRGDSFQVLLSSPPLSVMVALIIRSKLKFSASAVKEKWDARISIGIGPVSYNGEGVKDSDGVAFELSGRGLAELEKSGERLVIKAPWQRADQSLGLVTRFADNIISNWSGYSAEVAYYSLVYKERQIALADRMGKGQSTINGRISTAKLELIDAYIQYVKEQVGWGLREWH